MFCYSNGGRYAKCLRQPLDLIILSSKKIAHSEVIPKFNPAIKQSQDDSSALGSTGRGLCDLQPAAQWRQPLGSTLVELKTWFNYRFEHETRRVNLHLGEWLLSMEREPIWLLETW